jgi:GT2 family glycosyltransferase
VYKDWLERLIAPFVDPQVALVYGKQRGNEVTKYAEHQVFARWFPEKSNLLQTQPFCNNANAAIRRALWEHQSYDEDLTGLEDIDWAKRITRLGYHIAYAADAEIIHVHNEKSRQTYNRYRREAIALRHIFPQERFHLWDFLRLFLSNVVSDYYHAWHDGLVRDNVMAIPLFRLMQFWGAYRGFAHTGPVASHLKHTFYYPNERVRPAPAAVPLDLARRVEYTEHKG